MSSASYAHWIEKEKENPESEYASLKNMEDGQIVQSDRYSFWRVGSSGLKLHLIIVTFQTL